MSAQARIPLCLALTSLFPVMALDIGPVEMHGFVSQGYLKTDDNNYLADDSSDGSGKFFEAALNASWQPTKWLRVGAQGFSYTLGDLGDYDVALDWAYVDVSPMDEIGVRAGLIKQPRGFYNEYQDIDLARATVLMPSALYDPILRDYNLSFWGGDVYGVLRTGSSDVEYHAYVGTRDLQTDGGVSTYFLDGLLKNGIEAELDDISQGALYGGSLIWNSPVNGLRFGFSLAFIDHLKGEYSGTLVNAAAIGQNPLLNGTAIVGISELENYQNWIMSAEYVWSDYRITAEYNQTQGDLTSDLTLLIPLGFGGPVTIHSKDTYEPKGGYFQSAWRFHPQFEVAATGSFYFLPDNTSDPSGHQYDYFASLRYDPLDWLTLKAEIHYIEGYAQMQQLINPNGFEDTTWMGAFKATASF